MATKSYRKGQSFESRFIAKLLKDGIAVKTGRFYASKGVTDVWWVDQKGHHNEAQLKFSGIRDPYISPKEIQNLQEFAAKMGDRILVWLVKKQFKKKITMERIFV